MKRILKGVLLAIVAISLVLASCGGGGNSPKALAKQSVEVLAEGAKLTKDGIGKGDAKYEALTKKGDAIKEKVKNLSAEDKEIYDEEVKRLFKEASK
jgi:cell division protein FtsB